EADTECDGYAYVWTLTYDATGLYFKEDSEITIKYADDTYAVLVYEQGDGYLKIMVPEEYKDTCPDVLLIESAHCETDGKYLD
nr:hypothetical protein [Eubacterium sp.]